MAALPYMQLYVADYLADTAHLTTEEHGAYLLLLFNYWQTGKPILKERLNRIARVQPDNWKPIERTLSEFFEDDGERWVHLRIEKDLDAVMTSPRGKKLPDGDSLSGGYRGYVYFVTGPDTDLVKVGYSKNPWARLVELRRSNGSSVRVVATIKTVDKSEVVVHKVLGEHRDNGEWFRKSPLVEALIASVASGDTTTTDQLRDFCNAFVVPATATTNTDTDTDTNTNTNTRSKALSGKAEKSKPTKPEFVLPNWIDSKVWADYVDMRKQIKKPITENAKHLAVSALKKFAEQGHSPNAILNQSTLNSWQGLFEVKNGQTYSRSGAGAGRGSVSLSEKVRLKNAHLFADEQPEPFGFGDFDSEFDRIKEVDGSIVGADD